MSLHHAAQHLAAQGRGPDRTLVHMAPSEVQGLQALAKAHGGSLTVNPETGLAEAGFLSNILPTLIGVGLTAATGGAAAPWMIGAGVGGLQALRTGSLKDGLLAGMGAYGGAGIAGGLMSAGASTAQNAAAAGVEQAAADQAAAAASGEAASQAAMQQAGTQSAAESARLASQNAIASQTGQAAADAAAQQAAMETAKANAMAQASTNAMANPFTTMGQGAQSLTTEAGRNAFSNYANNATMGVAKTGLAAAAPALAGAMAPQMQMPGEEKYDGPLSRYSMSEGYQSYNPTPPNPYYQAQYKNYQYAGGGPIEQMSNANSVGMNTGYPGADIQQGAYATPWQTPVSRNMVAGSADTGVNPMTGEMSFAGGGDVAPKMKIIMGKALSALGLGDNQSQAMSLSADYQPYDPNQKFAGGGGISDLGGYSDGGRMLKGPGDGMSDSIPAQIGGKQPARLADGEFVVPADVVSHLGNGSTDAGAKQLYKMMDRIRSARTGKKKQAPEVNPGKAMPA